MKIENMILYKTLQRCKNRMIEDTDKMIHEFHCLDIKPQILYDFRRELIADVERLETIILEINRRIQRVEDETLIRVLTLRFCEGYKIHEIGQDLNYTNQWIHTLIKRGCDKYASV